MGFWILAAVLAVVNAVPARGNPIGEDNAAPVISGFMATEVDPDIWKFTGTVTDSDDNPAGWTVYFYGVIDGQSTTVRSDGTFRHYAFLGSSGGTAGAQTEDPHGNKSNIATTEVY